MKTCSIVNKCIIDNKEMLIKMKKHWIFVTKMMVNKVAFIARFQIDKNHLTPGKLRWVTEWEGEESRVTNLPVSLSDGAEQRDDAPSVGLGHGSPLLQQQPTHLQLPPTRSRRQSCVWHAHSQAWWMWRITIWCLSYTQTWFSCNVSNVKSNIHGHAALFDLSKLLHDISGSIAA